MKKIFGIITTALLLAAAIVSCDNDGNHAESNCSFIVLKDSLIYSDSTDVKYDSIVKACIDSVGLTGYIFSEEAQVDNSSIDYAVYLCNQQAIKKYDTNLKTIPTLSSFSQRLYRDNFHYFDSLGIHSAADIDLHPFTVNVNLWNLTYRYKIKSTTVNIR